MSAIINENNDNSNLKPEMHKNSIIVKRPFMQLNLRPETKSAPSPVWYILENANSKAIITVANNTIK